MATLSLAGLVLAAGLVLGGCADEPQLGNGVNTYTTNPSVARLRIFEVDQELSRQAQAGSLDLAALPAGRLSYPQETSGGNDGPVVTWVVKSGFFFTQIDLFFVDVKPAGDGTYTVTYVLSDEQGRDNSSRLQQMTAAMASAAAANGDQASLAIVYNETVRAIVPVGVPIDNGQVTVTGLTQAEADAIAAEFWTRSEALPNESQ